MGDENVRDIMSRSELESKIKGEIIKLEIKATEDFCCKNDISCEIPISQEERRYLSDIINELTEANNSLDITDNCNFISIHKKIDYRFYFMRKRDELNKLKEKEKFTQTLLVYGMIFLFCYMGAGQYGLKIGSQDFFLRLLPHSVLEALSSILIVIVSGGIITYAHYYFMGDKKRSIKYYIKLILFLFFIAFMIFVFLANVIDGVPPLNELWFMG